VERSRTRRPSSGIGSGIKILGPSSQLFRSEEHRFAILLDSARQAKKGA
jgi:hypothetical protein